MARNGSLRGLQFLLEAHDVLVGNLPTKMLLRTTLLEVLFQKDGAARISNKRAGRRQENVSGAVLDFNSAPKKG